MNTSLDILTSLSHQLNMLIQMGLPAAIDNVRKTITTHWLISHFF
jgi:hypothetical protein